MARIGIPLNLNLLSHAIWFNKVLRDPKIEWDLAGYGVGYAHAAGIGLRYFETNSKVAPDGKSLGGYANPEFDKWVSKAEMARDEQESIRYYQEAEKVLLRDVAAIPLFPFRMLIAYNKKVKGLKCNDTACIFVTTPWANVWIEE
ncbi:MAG: hypothetical protein JRJ31_21590 [Deltaproteobacteria bacterium]|nr:hypothetical protein [Deltaproteobacteria bacterium]